MDKHNRRDNGDAEAVNNGIQTLEEATSTMTSWLSSLEIDQSPAEAANCFSRPYSNSHHTQVRRSSDNREEGLLHEFEYSRENWRSSYFDGAKEPFIQPESLENLDELTFGVQGLSSDPESIPESRKLCFLFIVKRGIIARDDLSHALYIIPVDDFQKKYPKIKQYEAVVCHGTEFPMAEEKQSKPNSLFHRIWIGGICKIHFEMVRGETFSIVSPSEISANVTEILSRSEDRVGCGFSAVVLTRCTGGKDQLFEDNIRIRIESEGKSFHFMLPIAYYEANISPWLYNSHAVTAMPDEDREVLRSCHVSLLKNIANPISLCDHLYQHKVFDIGDLEEVQNITRKRDQNAFVLRTIQTRGNILDLVIEIMRGQRENQEAAAILQRKRH